MIFYNIGSIASMVILTAILVGVIIKGLRKSRRDRIKFIRGFKKGNCAIIYVAAIPIYFMGIFHSTGELINSVFAAINQTLSLVVLRFNFSDILPLMEENPLYAAAVVFCVALVVLNAFLLAISLLQQRIFEHKSGIKWRFGSADRLLVVGYNPQSLCIYRSEEKRRKIILDKLTADAKSDLFMSNIPFIDEENYTESIKELFEITEKFKESSMTVVINLFNDDKHIEILRRIRDDIRTYATKHGSDKKSAVELFSKIKIYVFGSPEYETIYNEIVENSCGCIHYVNKYKQIALDFANKYPLTRFMTDKQIDYSTSLVRPEVSINVALIGFGRTGSQIFLSTVVNNQFLTEKNGRAETKHVNYYIYDKKLAEHNKNLNHTYYRYKNEILGKRPPEDYLPLPALPANEIFGHFDINCPDFYINLKNMCESGKSFNYVIITFGSDLENIDLATKIVEKKREWGVEDLYVFVKVRSGNTAYSIFDRSDCFAIADEAHAVYNINEIMHSELSHIAQMRDQAYAVENEIRYRKEGEALRDEDEILVDTKYGWYIEKTQLERDSNVYAALSIRAKLNLLGIDYSKRSDVDALTHEEYLEYYAHGDMPEYYDSLVINGKKIVKYPLDFTKSKRTYMAIQEHYRWNAYMISRGAIPATRDEILNETAEKNGKYVHTNGKNHILRRHGNLTTFEGLLEFRKMIAERDGKSEIDTDVIKYDYQILDDAWWFLSSQGYKIYLKDGAFE